MTDKGYAQQLRKLSSDYYHNHIDFDEYRQQRRQILDHVDTEMNAHLTQTEQQEEADSSSVFMQTIGFFKNKSIDR